MTHYVAKRLLSHSVTGEYIQPGERVDLSHLTPDEIMMLETMDPPAIEAVKDAPPNAAKPAPGDGQEG